VIKEKQQLVVQQIPKLRRYSRALTGDKNSADDLVQDTLARALSRLELWSSGTDLRAWLFTIMHNVFINNIKQHNRMNASISIEEVSDTLSHSESQSTTIELSDCLQALGSLPYQQREVVLLVALEGMRYTEVAEVLGIPVGTVMSRLSRGRNAIRLAMEGKQHINPLTSVK